MLATPEKVLHFIAGFYKLHLWLEQPDLNHVSAADVKVSVCARPSVTGEAGKRLCCETQLLGLASSGIPQVAVLVWSVQPRRRKGWKQHRSLRLLPVMGCSVLSGFWLWVIIFGCGYAGFGGKLPQNLKKPSTPQTKQPVSRNEICVGNGCKPVFEIKKLPCRIASICAEIGLALQHKLSAVAVRTSSSQRGSDNILTDRS